jgi:tetratricopeptide (TPR) repeat protein
VAWSDAGDAGAAHQVMLDAVRVLNGAPPFRSRPTPWCPTVVAFAKIGQPEWVEKISTGLLAHEAFDGCSALIDLARLARERNDLTAAEAYLQTARANAPRITFPPMQAGLLALLAQEYARLGKLDDAVADDIVTPMASAEAHDRIAAVLAAADRVDEARAMLAKAGSVDRGLAPRAVADAYMRRGAFDDAHAVITSMSQASDRGSALAALASSLFAAGRREEADHAVSAALDAAHELDMFGRFTVLQEIVTTLHRADERPAAVRLVEDEWRTAATRSAVLGLAALAQPLATDLPTIGAHMVAGRDWVTEMLMMN